MVSRLCIQSVLLCVIGVVGLSAFAAAPKEIRTMQMTTEAGSECPATGVKVEAVTRLPDESAQVVVISIPRKTVAEVPNFRFYRADTSAVAFQNFQELRSGKPERRRFSVVVGEAEKFVFKLGFDSSQEP